MAGQLACRICGAACSTVLDLGQQVITSRFPVFGDFSTPSTPIVLVMCSACSLVQLRDTVESAELYEHEYGYRSGISNTMRQHLGDYNAEIRGKVALTAGDTVLDIGSNDSTFLRFYPAEVSRVGCDPTGKQFAEFYGDGLTLIPTYFTRANVVAKLGEVNSSQPRPFFAPRFSFFQGRGLGRSLGLARRPAPPSRLSWR